MGQNGIPRQGVRGCPKSNNPAPAPAPPPNPGGKPCGLKPGDIVFASVSHDKPDSFSVVTLVPLRAGCEARGASPVRLPEYSA